ncbi:hypothetical protein JFQ93_001534 [Aeromonas sobria]|nr:hypothetical protein [Aeromonas sobria]
MADFRGSTTPIDTRDLTQTPMFLFRALNREFNFALDAAALPETALCQHYLTPARSGTREIWPARSATSRVTTMNMANGVMA